MRRGREAKLFDRIHDRVAPCAIPRFRKDALRAAVAVVTTFSHFTPFRFLRD